MKLEPCVESILLKELLEREHIGIVERSINFLKLEAELLEEIQFHEYLCKM